MAGKNRIEINKSKNKEIFVSVKSANNRKIVTSETYKNITGAKNAVNALKKIIKNPVVVDNTKKKKTA